MQEEENNLLSLNKDKVNKNKSQNLGKKVHVVSIDSGNLSKLKLEGRNFINY